MGNECDEGRMWELCRAEYDIATAKHKAIIVGARNETLLPLALLLFWIKLTNLYLLLRSYNDCGKLFRFITF
jgi:hypothetical protein